MSFWKDLSFGARVLRKSPGYTIVGVLSLALGIGANSAMFSVVHAVLLRPLPYPDPDGLMRVVQRGKSTSVSVPELEFWKQHSTVLASAAGYRGGGDRTLLAGSRQEPVRAMTVTADFFRTLGVPPALGREFNAAETKPAGPQAAVISDGLWQRVFHSDPAACGRALTLDNASYTVVGVLPRGFWFPDPSEVLLPIRPTGSLGDTGYNTEMIARLKPGISLSQASQEMRALTQGFLDLKTGNVMRDYAGLMPTPYQAMLVGDVRLDLWLLLAAVALLLLIACSNLASLLLSRLAVRQKEIAVRLALGSSGLRLLRQFLAENLLLTTGGCAAGLAGANGLLRGLLAATPFDLPSSEPIRIDPVVLAFTLAIAVATAIAFSLTPFLNSSRMDVHETLKSAGRAAMSGPERRRARSVLVVSEVALSVTLLVTAALLIQSLYRLRHENLGFDPGGLITFRTPLRPEQRQTGADLGRFTAAMAGRFAGLPGVSAVAATTVVPLTGQSNIPAQQEGNPDHSIGGMEVREVTPEYFAAMKIPLLRGRAFAPSDSAGAQPVIVVNETVARQWWKQGDPLGGRVVIGLYNSKTYPEILDDPRLVVGVVGDTKTVLPQETMRPTVYVPLGQLSDKFAKYTGSIAWVVRSERQMGIAESLRRAIADADPRQRIGRFQPVQEIVDRTTAGSRFDALLFSIFAALALVLSAVGVFGVLSFSVARRTQEFGTRMALGASRGAVLGMVLRQGAGLILAGLAIGLGAAYTATRYIEKMLYGVKSTDPLSFATVAALLLAVGVLASWLPARRATKVDPMVALRYE